MSRSHKKLPITGHAMADSDKAFKQNEHGRERVNVRSELTRVVREEDFIMTASEKDFGNPAHGPKDGKKYHSDPETPMYQIMMK